MIQVYKLDGVKRELQPRRKLPLSFFKGKKCKCVFEWHTFHKVTGKKKKTYVVSVDDVYTIQVDTSIELAKIHKILYDN